MKKIRNTLLIIGLVAIIAVLGFVLSKNTNDLKNSTGSKIKIETQDLESITIVSIGMVQGKVITKSEDIKAICDVFDATDMEVIEDWDGLVKMVGDNAIVFRFNYSSGTVRQVNYNSAIYLIEGDVAYSINSTEFEKFWDLDYPAQRWDFKENKFAETE